MNNFRKEALKLELTGRCSTTSVFTTFNLIDSFKPKEILLKF